MPVQRNRNMSIEVTGTSDATQTPQTICNELAISVEYINNTIISRITDEEMINHRCGFKLVSLEKTYNEQYLDISITTQWSIKNNRGLEIRRFISQRIAEHELSSININIVSFLLEIIKLQYREVIDCFRNTPDVYFTGETNS